MKYKIYTICCPKTKDVKYVGCTTLSLSTRKSQHLYDAKRKSRPLHQWIKNNGFQIKLELLEEVDEKQWKLSESYWIGQFKQWGYSLLNIDLGGKGIVKGLRKNTILSHHKPVDMFDETGNYLKTFVSIKDAVGFLKLKSESSITNILAERGTDPKIANKRKSFAKGFRWAFSGEKPSPILIYKITYNGSVYRFFSLMKAQEVLKIPIRKHKKHLKTGSKAITKNFTLEYDIV
jgi:hypothetical protein